MSQKSIDDRTWMSHLREEIDHPTFSLASPSKAQGLLQKRLTALVCRSQRRGIGCGIKYIFFEMDL